MTADLTTLAARVEAIDDRMRLELVDDCFVLTGPASLPAAAEVQALRLIHRETAHFVCHFSDEPAVAS